MPTSFNHTDEYFISDLKEIIKPSICFDVGTGYGKRGRIVKSLYPDCKIIGFEFFKKYVDEKKEELKRYYNNIYICDFYDWIQKNVDWKADLIVFGDVLEHILKSRVYDILDMCLNRCRWIVIITPVGIRQNNVQDNIKEAHISIISLADLYKYNIYHYLKKGPLTYYLIRGNLPLENPVQKDLNPK